MSWLKEILEKIKKETDEGFVGERNTISANGVFALLKQQCGSVFVITALMLPVMLGFLGFAFDVGNLYIHKARLQNVVDAAALAGGHAFIESQEKAEGSRDTVDPSAGSGRDEETYVVGGSKSRTGNHPDADNAADAYIYKNIVNLGAAVKNDKYSHYALNSEGENPKTFYRIGLYEEVPLYFLPVILKNKKEQKVRAGAVVLVEKGNIVAQTLFDKLFAVQDKINISRNVVSPQGDDAMGKKPNSPDDPNSPGENGAKILTSFDGDIVFTSDQWASVKASAIVQDNQIGGYLYTKEEQAYQLANNLSIKELNEIPNMGVKSVWDNTVGIDSYVSGFLNKLNRPHVDLLNTCNVNLETFETSKISGYKNRDSNHQYTVTTSKGTTIYYHKIGNENIPCGLLAYVQVEGNTYYSFQKEGSGFNDASNNNSWVPCTTYVVDTNGNKIFCYKNGEDWSFYRKKEIVHSEYYTEIQYQGFTATLVSDNADGTTYSYNDNSTTVSFSIEKIGIDFSQGILVNKPVIDNSNVFHWQRADNQQAILKVDGLSGDESNPVYIILTGGSPIKITVTQSNDRPIIFCNLTTTEINDFSINPGVTFKGTIYSPYAKVTNVHAGTGSSGGSYVGNILAKELDIQDAGNTWTQKNFVAEDSDLNTVTEAMAEAQEARKQQAINLAKSYLAGLELGINDTTWQNPSWFSSQSDVRKAQIKKAWYDARQYIWETYGLDMPDWPWSEGGKTTDSNKHHYNTSTGLIGGKVRIINFRTEYISEPYIDPFTQLFLVEVEDN